MTADWNKFFETMGKVTIRPDVPFSIEDLYQAFAARMMEEIKDRTHWHEMEKALADTTERDDG